MVRAVGGRAGRKQWSRPGATARMSRAWPAAASQFGLPGDSPPPPVRMITERLSPSLTTTLWADRHHLYRGNRQLMDRALARHGHRDARVAESGKSACTVRAAVVGNGRWSKWRHAVGGDRPGSGWPPPPRTRRWAGRYVPARIRWKARRSCAAGSSHTGAGRACSCDRVGCPDPGAHPISPAWQNQATVDTAVITRWWRDWPDANVLLVTGRVFDVLEVPAAAGRIAVDTFAQLSRARPARSRRAARTGTCSSWPPGARLPTRTNGGPATWTACQAVSRTRLA